MGWKGMTAGFLVGKLLFGGSLGAIIGAVLGHQIEKGVKGRPNGGANGGAGGSDARRREAVFCASAAAILAKMAKADGRVTSDEIESVERAFARLGFGAQARRYAIEVFRRAKDDDHDIYEYAREFAEAVRSLEVRELFYELLWDIAQSDGDVTEAEHDILNRITEPLGIGARWYEFMARGRHSRARTSSGGRRESSGWGSSRSSDPLAEAYATLGVASTASNAEVKSAYRSLAKKYHPDVLRAQGLPDEMLDRATERMAKVNAAWDLIKNERGMKG